MFSTPQLYYKNIPTQIIYFSYILYNCPENFRLNRKNTDFQPDNSPDFPVPVEPKNWVPISDPKVKYDYGFKQNI